MCVYVYEMGKETTNDKANEIKFQQQVNLSKA